MSDNNDKKEYVAKTSNNHRRDNKSTSVLKNTLLSVAIFFGVISVLLLGLVTWWFYKTVANPPPSTPNVTIINQGAVLEAVKSVNKQTFIEHDNMVPIVYSEVPEGWIGMLGLKQEMVVIIRGKVAAGFDLSQLDGSDVWVSKDGKRAQITLPPPVIFEDNVAIDFENSQILTQSDLCPDFLCQNSLEAYQGEVLPNARQLIIDAAHENGILNQAARDGKLYYQQLLSSLGFEDVRVIVDGYE